MLRRTKILATLGPATDKKDTLDRILRAGVNVIRINFSHGGYKEHLTRVQKVHAWEKENNIYVGVLMDLQGPKIRIRSFENGDKIKLNKGDKFILDADLGDKKGTKIAVGVSYKLLPQEVKFKDILLLDDGRIALKVDNVNGNKIITTVIQAGVLTGNKGINLKGGGLSAKALTPKDKKDILIAARANADYVALSFVTSGDDIREAKKLLLKAGCNAGVIAKIERSEALEELVLMDIINESAGIMIARGDLGVEIGDSLLPAQQKYLIKLARAHDRIVIVATQMLESMINNPVSTRAEVFDVANAVLDGTDAVMLSAETAIGDFPCNAVKTMHNVCIEAEKNPIAKVSHHRLHEHFNYIDETIAMSAMYAANHLGVKVVSAITQTGKTVIWMSRMSSNVLICAISDNIKTLHKVTLCRGVYPCGINKISASDWSEVNKKAIKILIKHGIVKSNDLVIITKGMYKDKSGGTNMMKILRVGSFDY